MGHIDSTIKSVTRHCDSQIHTCNLKDPVKKGLLSLYRSFFLYIVVRFSLGFGIKDNVFFV